ncbi:hypothetical protein NEF87_001916 [Candidatus Lokiarchaeum ossiferum]|uniref:DUF2785 domain-containing protein n=1 Tax=Candidatus Lokiarchaeum ossiferum TaxID=2951803 RepID=A0ABY6HSV3_9ARCH|nr:hypothetical protein NEF87_001916 [Candidatus Lokiarchaeum sp. B-35]
MKLEDIKWIMENSFAVFPNSTLTEQTEILMDYLGSPVSDLREGALEILYEWIMKGNYSNEELLIMGDRLAKNLLVGIGEQNTDTVFLRAFSALILESIIDFDSKCALKEIEGRIPFLSKDQLLAYLKTSIQYYHDEKDTRGSVVDKGWAHSIAHGADLFGGFARHRFMDKQELNQILELIKFKITEPIEEIYTCNEDFRIAVTVYIIFMRKILAMDEMSSWIQSVRDVYPNRWISYSGKIASRNGFLNSRIFFHSFHLLVKFGINNEGFYSTSFYKNHLLDDRTHLCEKIEDILLKMNSTFLLQKKF